MTILVCGTDRGMDAAEGVCTECHATIWPTTGSFRRAQIEHLPMICIDCYGKMDDSVFTGFMHHGVMLPEGLSLQLFEEVKTWLASKDRERGV